MDISIFLARVFGLYFVLMGLVFLAKSNHTIQVIREFYQNRALVFVVAWFTLILGILMVVSHSIWKSDWRVIITVLGYLTLLKGLLHLFVAEIAVKASRINKNTLRYLSVGVLSLGGLLLWFSVS